jgi:hypothetical protein
MLQTTGSIVTLSTVIFTLSKSKRQVKFMTSLTFSTNNLDAYSAGVSLSSYMTPWNQSWFRILYSPATEGSRAAYLGGWSSNLPDGRVEHMVSYFPNPTEHQENMRAFERRLMCHRLIDEIQAGSGAIEELLSVIAGTVLPYLGGGLDDWDYQPSTIGPGSARLLKSIVSSNPIISRQNTPGPEGL